MIAHLVQVLEETLRQLILQLGPDLHRDPVEQLNTDRVRDGGVVAVVLEIILGIVIVAMAAKNVMLPEETVDGARLRCLVREWRSRVGQPHGIHDLPADLVQPAALQVVVPVMVADHVMDPDLHRQPAG